MDSSGSATERMQIQAESLTGKLNSLQSSWDNFVMSLGTNEIIKSVVDALTGFVDIVNTLLNKIPILSNVIKTALVAGAINTLLGALTKLTEKAKSGGMLGGLFSSEQIINFAKAIKNNGVSAFNLFIQSLDRAKASGKGLNTAFKMFGASLKELAAGGTAAAAGISATGTAEAGAIAPTIGLAGAFKALMTAIAPLLAIGAIVSIITMAADRIKGSLEKLKDDAEASAQALQETESQLSNVESQIADIRQQIADVNSEGPLSITEQQQTDMLQDQLELLQQQQAILQQQKKNQAIQNANDNLAILQKMQDVSGGLLNGGGFNFDKDAAPKNSWFNSNDAYDFLVRSARETGNGNNPNVNSDFLATNNATIDDALDRYKKLLEYQDEYIQKGEQVPSGLTEAIGYVQDNIYEWQNLATTIQKSYNEAKAAGASDEELAGIEAQMQAVQDFSNEIIKATDPDSYQKLQISQLFDDSDLGLGGLRDKVNQLMGELSNGNIDQNQFNQQVSDLINTAASDQKVQDAFKSLFGNITHIDTNSIAAELADQLGVTFDKTVQSIDISSFDNLKSQIEDTIGGLSDDLEGASDGFTSAMKEMEDTMDMSSLNSALDNMSSVINSYQDELDSLSSTFNSLGTNVDNAVTVIDTVSANMDALMGNTELTGEQTQELYNTLASMPSVIDPMTGAIYDGFTLANIAIGNTSMSSAESQEYVQSFLGGVQNAGNNTITTMNYVIDAINQVKIALAGALSTASGFVSKASDMISNLGSGLTGKVTSLLFGIDESDFQSAAKSLDSLAGQLKSQSASISASVTKSQASMIQQTKAYEAALKNAGNSANKAYGEAIKGAGGAAKGAGKAKNATDDLTDALKGQYEAQKAVLEQQKEALQAQKEANQEELDGLNDARDAIEDLIDVTMDMLKQQYEDEQDALDDQLDAFEEKINKQKDYLDLLKDEEEHQDELAEKNRNIADIQAQLEELRYDTSASGQAQRLELLEQLNEAQKELSDYQADYDYDTKQDALDKELDSFKAQIDAQKDYIENVLMDEYNLYQQAIELIQGRSQEFYNDLIEYNRVYGSHIDQDIIQKWNLAYAALNEYGYLGVGVQGVLEGIAARCIQVENENKAIEESIKAIENEMKSLENSYNAAVKAAQDLASASNSARDAANGAISAYNQLQNTQKQNTQVAGGGGGGGVFREHYAALYHSGTDYVKPASSWLNKMLGLNEDETAAILKKGEAVIPDYANPFNDDGKYNPNFAVASPSTIAPASNNDVEYNYKVEIGDIVIEGDADENTVKQLRKVKDEITDNVFKTINKLQNIGGYKNTKIAH